MATYKINKRAKYQNMKIFIFCIGSFLSMASCCQNKSPVVIRQFHPFKNMYDTLIAGNKVSISKSEYFIISNYCENDSTDYDVELFVKNNMDKNYDSYAGYQMIFYKESEFTNERYVKENPRSIDRYSQNHDLLYEYFWEKTRLVWKLKYKNGKIISPANKVRIEDVH